MNKFSNIYQHIISEAVSSDKLKIVIKAINDLKKAATEETAKEKVSEIQSELIPRLYKIKQDLKPNQIIEKAILNELVDRLSKYTFNSLDNAKNEVDDIVDKLIKDTDIEKTKYADNIKLLLNPAIFDSIEYIKKSSTYRSSNKEDYYDNINASFKRFLTNLDASSLTDSDIIEFDKVNDKFSTFNKNAKIECNYAIALKNDLPKYIISFYDGKIAQIETIVRSHNSGRKMDTFIQVQADCDKILGIVNGNKRLSVARTKYNDRQDNAKYVKDNDNEAEYNRRRYEKTIEKNKNSANIVEFKKKSDLFMIEYKNKIQSLNDYSKKLDTFDDKYKESRIRLVFNLKYYNDLDNEINALSDNSSYFLEYDMKKISEKIEKIKSVYFKEIDQTIE
jgi:hypothetical protein